MISLTQYLAVLFVMEYDVISNDIYSPPSSQKMASRFALVSEKEIISVNKEAVPTDTKMATKFVYSWHSKYPSLLIIE